jgi:hypothetical protein
VSTVRPLLMSSQLQVFLATALAADANAFA